jgi:hypothetical protein
VEWELLLMKKNKWKKACRRNLSFLLPVSDDLVFPPLFSIVARWGYLGMVSVCFLLWWVDLCHLLELLPVDGETDSMDTHGGGS